MGKGEEDQIREGKLERGDEKFGVGRGVLLLRRCCCVSPMTILEGIPSKLPV